MKFSTPWVHRALAAVEPLRSIFEPTDFARHSGTPRGPSWCVGEPPSVGSVRLLPGVKAATDARCTNAANSREGRGQWGRHMEGATNQDVKSTYPYGRCRCALPGSEKGSKALLRAILSERGGWRASIDLRSRCIVPRGTPRVFETMNCGAQIIVLESETFAVPSTRQRCNIAYNYLRAGAGSHGKVKVSLASTRSRCQTCGTPARACRVRHRIRSTIRPATP